MSDFDEIWNDGGALSSCSRDEAEDFYNEGAQPQQAKIDELQARIDQALKHLDLAYPESWGYCVDQAIDILKGNKDENY